MSVLRQTIHSRTAGPGVLRHSVQRKISATKTKREIKGRSEVRIWKRTKFYWYEFVFEGRRVRASSKQSDRETAQSIASEHRSRLAKQGWGIERPKPVAVRELLDKLETDYKLGGKWSAQNRSLL